jgi:hypothetical protein
MKNFSFNFKGGANVKGGAKV